MGLLPMRVGARDSHRRSLSDAELDRETLAGLLSGGWTGCLARLVEKNVPLGPPYTKTRWSEPTCPLALPMDAVC